MGDDFVRLCFLNKKSIRHLLVLIICLNFISIGQIFNSWRMDAANEAIIILLNKFKSCLDMSSFETEKETLQLHSFVSLINNCSFVFAWWYYLIPIQNLSMIQICIYSHYVHVLVLKYILAFLNLNKEEHCYTNGA